MKRIITLIALHLMSLSILVISSCCSKPTQTEDYYDLTKMTVMQASIDTTISGRIEWREEELNTINPNQFYGFRLSWEDSFVRKLSTVSATLGNMAYACEESYFASLLISDIASIEIFSLTEVKGFFSNNEEVSGQFRVTGDPSFFDTDTSSVKTYIYKCYSSVHKQQALVKFPVLFYLNHRFEDGQELQFELVAELQDGRQFRSKTDRIRVEN